MQRTWFSTSPRRAGGTVHRRILAVVLLLIILLPPGAILGQETNEQTRTESHLLRYEVSEGDRWQDTFKREFHMDFKNFKPDVPGPIGEKERNLQGMFRDRIETETRIQNVREDLFSVHMKIQRYNVKFRAPVLKIDYDSETDNSGIYHRMFGPWIGKTVSLLLDRQGTVKNMNGFNPLLNSIRRHLPDPSSKSFMTEIIQAFTSMYVKSTLPSYLKLGWVKFPENPVRIGETWPWETGLFRFIVEGPWGRGAVHSNTKFTLRNRPDNRFLVEIRPDVQHLQFRTVSKERKNEEVPDNKLMFSPRTGIHKLQLGFALKGNKENQATVKFFFSRE